MHDRLRERACDASSHHISGRTPLRLSGLAALIALSACRSAAEYHTAADDEVYGILEQRHAELQLSPGGFTIAPPADSLRQRILAGDWPVSADDPAAEMVLTEVLEAAAENSRTYQTRRENLYLAALDLTLERFLFRNQYFGTLSADGAGDGNGVTSKNGDASAGFTRLLGTGATILSNIGISLFNDLSTGGGWETVSNIGMAFTQPLLRGSGARIVKEPLTQAERDVVYEVRSFERFRRTFAFDVSSGVYRIIQQIETTENRRVNFVSLTTLRLRNEAMGRAGRMNAIDVDQARRDQLDAEQALVLAQQSLDEQLDALKLLMGLPIEAALTVDPDELARIDLDELVPKNTSEQHAIEIALANRLDHLTVIDQVNDAERKLYIAKDALRAGASVSANFSAQSDRGNVLKFSKPGIGWGLGATVDLPFNRFAERNAYRTAEITLRRAERALEDSRDRIVAEVRDDLRTLDVAGESFKIQIDSVAVAERAKESTLMNLDAGRASTRDVLEAERSLVNARNALVAARTAYVLAALGLFLDLEVLRVDETGLEVDPEMYLQLVEA